MHKSLQGSAISVICDIRRIKLEWWWEALDSSMWPFTHKLQIICFVLFPHFVFLLCLLLSVLEWFHLVLYLHLLVRYLFLPQYFVFLFVLHGHSTVLHGLLLVQHCPLLMQLSL